MQRSDSVPGTESDPGPCFGAAAVWVVKRLSSDILIVNLSPLPWHWY